VSSPSRNFVLALAAIGLAAASVGAPIATASAAPGGIVRAALPANAIRHIIVVELENESFNMTFGPNSPAVFLNKTLVPQGELVENYYATGHVSLDNYIAQISGQAPNPLSSSDCLQLPSFAGSYVNVVPGTLDPDQATFPGQVDGSGCIYPASVQTIADQLDAARGGGAARAGTAWRVYAEDMGNDPARDMGTPDPLGGTDCAHPVVGGNDPTNSATPIDQYATRHNPAV
jgi:phosphatidylinositol-3-phosphatase